MDPVGMGAVGSVLAVALAGGAWWKRSNGRLRDVAPVDNGGKLSDPAGLLVPAQNGVGGGGGVAVDNDENLSHPAALLEPTQDGAGEEAGGGALDPALLAGLGVEPGDHVTLLQFSSAYCVPCRAVQRISSEVAGEIDGVRHLEVDAEQHLDAVRALGIWRTPTLLVIDRTGNIVKRATGVPRKPQLIAAVRETL
jgi:thiol-disulfide isomerase/thioredoxin